MTTTAIRSPELDALRVAPFFLPYVVYLVHTLEEIQGFADWATRNFGPETTGMFAGYHIPLMLLVGFTSWQAARVQRDSRWVIMATAFQWQFAVNALFHLTTWIWLGEYSPGVVTGAVVSIPVTIAYLIWVRRQRRISRRGLLQAMVIGTAIAAAAIGFLFL